MKLAVILSLVSAVAAGIVVDKRGGCHGNNCNRAVTGTRPGLEPLSIRSAHCSSFLLTTVTPSPTTVTVTVDDVEPTAPGKRGFLEARQTTVVPTSIPSYAAEMCANGAEYSTACSCFGVTGSVTTAPTPTVTVTTTYDYCEDL